MIAERKKIHCHPIVEVKAPDNSNPVTAPIAGLKKQGERSEVRLQVLCAQKQGEAADLELERERCSTNLRWRQTPTMRVSFLCQQGT